MYTKMYRLGLPHGCPACGTKKLVPDSELGDACRSYRAACTGCGKESGAIGIGPMEAASMVSVYGAEKFAGLVVKTLMEGMR